MSKKLFLALALTIAIAASTESFLKIHGKACYSDYTTQAAPYDMCCGNTRTHTEYEFVCTKEYPICYGFVDYVRAGKCTVDKLAPIKSDVDGIKAKVEALSPIKSDVDGIKAKVEALSPIKSDVESVKDDMESVKDDVDKIKQTISRLEATQQPSDNTAAESEPEKVEDNSGAESEQEKEEERPCPDGFEKVENRWVKEVVFGDGSSYRGTMA